MATHVESSVELSEHSNGPTAKHKAKKSQKTPRKRARRMSDSESDGDTGVHFLHDGSVRHFIQCVSYMYVCVYIEYEGSLKITYVNE